MADDLSHLDFDPEEPGVGDVPVPLLIHRAALFDVAENAKDLAEAVGLPPISAEQAATEREASTRRLFTTGRLNPALADHSAFLAAVFVRIQREAYRSQHDGTDLPDESWQSAYDHLQHMLNTTTVSAVSMLVELGALHVDSKWQQPSEQTDDSQH